MKKLIVLIAILFSSISVHAEDGVNRATIERLLDVTNTKSMIDSMYSQMDKMLAGLPDKLNIKESERPIFDKFMKKVVVLMKEDMAWDKMKEPMIEIYMKHYTEKEISEMLAFYQTETGQSLLAKMPVVMQESMQISQKMFQEFMPKLQTLAQEMEGELAQARVETQETQEAK